MRVGSTMDGHYYAPEVVESELMNWYIHIYGILRLPSSGDAWIDFFAVTLP